MVGSRITFDHFKIFLPYYLNDESQDILFSEIKKFVDDEYNYNLYTTKLSSQKYIFQGDCIEDLNFVFFPDQSVEKTLGLVISNTCDNTTENQRFLDMHIAYAPIIKLAAYNQLLTERYPGQANRIESHIQNIKKQRYTSMFYLSKHPYGLPEDSIVLLDKLSNCDSNSINLEIESKRKFVLSNFGHYLLLLKLSIHFTRMREKIDRDNGVIITD